MARTVGGYRKKWKSKVPFKPRGLKARALTTTKNTLVRRPYAIKRSYAPVNTGFRIKNQMSGNSALTVRHREYVKPIRSDANTDWTYYQTNIQPAQFKSFPWLSVLANSFEYYKIISLKAVFVPTVSTGEEGQIIQAFLYDSEKESADTFKSFLDMTNMQGSVASKIWQTSAVNLNKYNLRTQGKYYTRGSNQLQGTEDMRFYDAAVHYIGVQHNKINTEKMIGQLYFDYVVQFYSPIPRNNSGVFSNSIQIKYTSTPIDGEGVVNPLQCLLPSTPFYKAINYVDGNVFTVGSIGALRCLVFDDFQLGEAIIYIQMGFRKKNGGATFTTSAEVRYTIPSFNTNRDSNTIQMMKHTGTNQEIGNTTYLGMANLSPLMVPDQGAEFPFGHQLCHTSTGTNQSAYSVLTWFFKVNVEKPDYLTFANFTQGFTAIPVYFNIFAAKTNIPISQHAIIPQTA